MTQFWQLQEPVYSDYQRTFINGKAKFPFSLPGIQCDTCGQTWIDSVRVTPFFVPEGLDGLPDLSPRPVSPQEFNKISEALKEMLVRHYPQIGNWNFKPGQKMLPAIIDIPSIPKADFLWSGWCTIVSGRVRDALEEAKVTGVNFFPATIRKIGKKNAKLPPPAPSSGEPEDIMRHSSRIAADVQGVPDYFYMVITGESKWADYIKVESECSKCGFISWVPTGGWKMLESMWTGMGVFCLIPTTMIIVTDEVRQIIEKLEPTNVVYNKI